MRFPVFLFSFLFFLLAAARLNGQTVLFEADFNDCDLSPDWTVTSSGNPNSVWYVDVSQNPLILGQSIDGTCLLFIDDHAISTDTLGYVLNFSTPSFDGTSFTKVECTMDVYFRFGQNDFLQILATDGVTETELARFDKYWTNELNISDGHFSVRHDLSLVSMSPNTRIIIRYTSPNKSTGKFAAIDNVRITGSGAGVNVLGEAFNTCAIPGNWETRMVTGNNNWRFGKIELGSSAFYDGSSMDGSCFVYFDDSKLGASAQPATIRLLSPWFEGNAFLEYELNYDVIMRYSGAEHFRVYLQTSATDSVVLFQSDGQVGGPFFPDYVHHTFDLSPYRAELWRLVFEYSDGGLWGYWAGVDNVKVTGQWPANEYCVDALPLVTGEDCVGANNRSATFDGPAAACSGQTVGSLWYVWQANFTGVAKLTTAADFNAVVNIFTGTCNGLQPVTCDNRDEHGFAGESTYFMAQTGTEYRIRVSGQNEGFGLATGNLCVALVGQVPDFPARPANDVCSTATQLLVNTPCAANDNLDAQTATPLPSLNNLARANVWYYFVAGSLPSGGRYKVRSNATFSDIITLYQGACANLQEIAGNHFGGSLELPDLVPGQTYFVQIAGNFATVEGGLCPELVVEQLSSPPNDNCAQAINIPLGGPCVAGNNTGATYSGKRPACAVLADRDIWYKFVAPTSGTVRVNTGADFRHVLALWQGTCDSLVQIFCTQNPLRCDGYVTVGSLIPGQTYFVQIASWLGLAGRTIGTVCVRVVDAAAPLDLYPLQLTVSATCMGPDSAQLQVGVTGGTAPYTYTGDMQNEMLAVSQQYQVVVTDAAGCAQYQSGQVANCDSLACAQVTLATVKVFLQGPYLSNEELMHDSLRAKNLIPLTEPYSGLSNFTHTGGGGGEVITEDVLLATGSDAIVDWVFLELRAAANRAQVVATRSALLQRDGDVVDVDGVSPVTFHAPSGQYYAVAVRHRNHLGAQWGNSVYYPVCTAVETDFRIMPAAGFHAYNSLNPAQRLIGSFYTLWAGNGRVDYQLKYNGSTNDRSVILELVGLTTSNNTVAGYRLSDYNLDGLVKYNGANNDRNVLLGSVGITSPSKIMYDQSAR